MLATNVDGDGCFSVEERLPDPIDIVTICSSLIVIRDDLDAGRGNKAEDPIIQLAHFSVQEYLLSDRCFLKGRFSPNDCHTLLAEVSLIYTLHVCRNMSYNMSTDSDPNPLLFQQQKAQRLLAELNSCRDLGKRYPLVSYAWVGWYKHAAELSGNHLSQRAIEMSVALFENKDGLLTRWLLFHDPAPRKAVQKRRMIGSSASHVVKLPDTASPMFYAAATGMTQVAEVLVHRGCNVNESTNNFDTPLEVAAFSGVTRWWN